MQQPAGISTLHRETYFKRTASENFDVLIIGGGITGAGIALEAATRNLKVLLIEMQDFAAGTSSRSTKLIHGGLRYLKNYEFNLVRTVARERKILYKLAPHLVTPEPMLLPIQQGNAYGYFATAAGLTLYEFLGGVSRSERHTMLNREKTIAQEPLLDRNHLKGSGLFYEYRTDDARLTLEVLKTAASFGATCLNYTQLLDFTYSSENKINGALIQDNLTGRTVTVKARCTINAAGPWSAALVQKNQPITQPLLYHTKGVHLVVPFSRLPLKQSVYFDVPGGRMLFAIPRKNVTYFGTTDTPYTGDLKNPEVLREDADYLINLMNKMFPEVNLTLDDVTSSWAGIRPLIFEPGKKPVDISRKDEILFAESGLITIAGGKLTGYRHLSEEVVDKAIQTNFPEIKLKSNSRNIRLLAGNFDSFSSQKAFEKKYVATEKTPGIPAPQIVNLIGKYGRNFTTILDKAISLSQHKELTENGWLEAEIWYTIHAEAAASISDFLIRRTGMLYFEREKISTILPMVIACFRKYLNWSDEQVKKQTAEFELLYKAAIAFKNKPGC